ncbi:cysteine desulfurase [Candidatus Microgenomates bacterium]|nr:cysteine desulfurase [Candidatus Microgenomates bacterium]
MNKPVYFDYAAATPLDPRVAKAMQPYWAQSYYNPSALYEPARRTREALETARHSVAQVLGAKPGEIILTAGATEANNLALFGIASRHEKSTLVASAIEHESVLEPLQYLNRLGWKTKLVPVRPNGLVDLAALEKAINDQTALVSVMYANNEVGTIQPLSKIAQILNRIKANRRRRGVKRPLYFHSDAAQAPNYLTLQVGRLGVDLMTLNGGKIYGPKQSGCLYIKGGVELGWYILGGGQEKGIRSGTENVPGIIGFAKALELAEGLRVQESRRLRQLRDYAIDSTIKTIANVRLNGDHKQRLPNNINLSIEGVNGESLVHHLDAAGILVATGSACSANNEKSSHVLLALGLKPRQVNSSVRITLGRHTTKPQVDRLIKELKRAVKFLRAQNQGE